MAAFSLKKFFGIKIKEIKISDYSADPIKTNENCQYNAFLQEIMLKKWCLTVRYIKLYQGLDFLLELYKIVRASFSQQEVTQITKVSC